MRTKHPAKDSGNLCPVSSDPLLVPFGELRKQEGRYVSARGKSKCASVRDNSRSGGTTPRESPSPKCDRLVKEMDAETPRTYLIKDSFYEPDIKLAELCQPIKPENAASVPPAAKRFLSEIDEVDWSLDKARALGGGTSCSSSSGKSVDGEPNVMELIKQLKGKSQMMSEAVSEKRAWLEAGAERRGKAPMAFPTEEELPSCDDVKAASEASSTLQQMVESEMPAWLQDACRSLACLDDEVRLENSGASCSKNDPDDGARTWRSGDSVASQAQSGSGDDDDVGNWEGCGVVMPRSGSKPADEEREAESQQQEQEQEQQQGTGWLWKMSLCASVSFVTWVLMNGARVQCRSLLPTIRERDQPVKIERRKPNKMSVLEEQK